MARTNTTSPGTTGAAMLDRTPPSPSARIFSKPSPPGADTRSLMGGDSISPDGSNPSLQSPGSKLMLGTAMFMQGANIVESVSPGLVPDPVKQWIAQLMEQAPQMAEQMARGGNPGALLQAAGQSAPQSGPPMGMPAFGGNAGAGGPPMGGGAGGRPMPPA